MNQRSITEGLSRLVRIPALHAGGHGFKSHPLHSIHGFIQNFYFITKYLDLNKTKNCRIKNLLVILKQQ
jgi:hypothetical protein